MATYIKPTDYKDSDSKEQEFFKSANRYKARQGYFEKIDEKVIQSMLFVLQKGN